VKGLSVASAATEITPGSDAKYYDRRDIDPMPLPFCPYAGGLPLPSSCLEKEVCLNRIGKSGADCILEKDPQITVENSAIVAGQGAILLGHPF